MARQDGDDHVSRTEFQKVLQLEPQTMGDRIFDVMQIKGISVENESEKSKRGNGPQVCELPVLISTRQPPPPVAHPHTSSRNPRSRHPRRPHCPTASDSHCTSLSFSWARFTSA